MSQDLKEDLEDAIHSSSALAKRTYFWAQLLFFITIISSFFASILAAGELGAQLFPNYNKLVTAVLAALPGTAILINNSLRYEEKTKWFWKKTRVAEKFLRQLRDSIDPDVERISIQFSEKMEELESEWPAMDSPVKQPK